MTGGGYCASNDLETQERRAIESMGLLAVKRSLCLGHKGNLLTKGKGKIKSPGDVVTWLGITFISFPNL